jgi:superfamily I DNA/RNA helicase
MEFDADQRKVIGSPQGARSVVAGPGSGKTTTMVGMINHLLATGAQPSHIRAVTFSREMAQTLEKRVKVPGIVSTFHSLGYAICSSFGGERKPVEPELRFRLMVRLMRKWKISEYRDLDGFIARMRRERVTPEEAVANRELDYGIAQAYAEYERERIKQGWMDFDSMLADAVQFLEIAQNRARWQFKYLIVDEAQDTDNLQWRMMQLMSEKHGNITVVGDPNQAIYSFRGAKPENITNFQQWFPTGAHLYLGQNYRSTQNLVQFIRENVPAGTPDELLQRMRAVRDVKGASVGIKMYWTPDEEAESALALAQKDPKNSIILTRTNHWVGLLERVCAHHHIPYHLLGQTGFWKQNEIQKAIAGLREHPGSELQSAFNIVLPQLESKYAVDDRTERDNDALENLKTLRIIGKDHKMTADFLRYANKMIHRRNNIYGITISTVHQAKGGEWQNVYVVGVNHKNFPHLKGEPQEEKRIYFVAISRAIDTLRISFSGTPSLYLRKYLTEEIMDKLRASADEVVRLQRQAKLFA